MLSYKHSFHAGNFADALKHVTLVYILDYLIIKSGPVCYLDTHAGSGAYELSSPEMQKNREYESGISLLWDQQHLPAPLKRYVELVHEFNGGDVLCRYPGSPWFARRILRPSDQLFLYEMHTNEYEILKKDFGRDRRTTISCDDGFKACRALLPPRQRRGVILIDPSYELKSDYRHVITSMKEAWRRFPTGVYLIWYPVVDRNRIERMEASFKSSGIKNILLLELVLSHNEAGMNACGMFIINPPWTLWEEMRKVLPDLAGLLGQKGKTRYRNEMLVSQ